MTPESKKLKDLMIPTEELNKPAELQYVEPTTMQEVVKKETTRPLSRKERRAQVTQDRLSLKKVIKNAQTSIKEARRKAIRQSRIRTDRP